MEKIPAFYSVTYGQPGVRGAVCGCAWRRFFNEELSVEGNEFPFTPEGRKVAEAYRDQLNAQKASEYPSRTLEYLTKKIALDDGAPGGVANKEWFRVELMKDGLFSEQEIDEIEKAFLELGFPRDPGYRISVFVLIDGYERLVVEEQSLLY